MLNIGLLFSIYAQEQLEVSGAIKIDTATSSEEGTIEYDGSDFRGYTDLGWKSLTSAIWNSGSANSIYYNSGNVGIGTSLPLSKFHLEGSSEIGRFKFNGTGWIALHNTTGYKGYLGIYSGSDDVDFGTGGGNSTGKVHLVTKAIPRLSIDANGNTGIGTTSPASDAILEMNSTSKGVLVPRMSNTERDDIAGGNPTDGLLIYSNDSDSFWYFDGDEWKEIGGNSPMPASISPHLIQPKSLSHGLAWTGVSGDYHAHFANNGEAAIIWEDDGIRYISRYQNDTWCHPQGINTSPDYDVFDSDMNNNGKILLTRVSGTKIIIEEVTTGGNTSVIAGPFETGITYPSPRISINDNGKYFVSFLKDIGGPIHLHVIGTGISSPLQISTLGSNATDHRISYSQDDKAVVFWVQNTTSGSEKGLYRSEYNGTSWQTMPGLNSRIDTSQNDGVDNIILKDIHSSIDGQFMILYDIKMLFLGNIARNHKRAEKRSGSWTISSIGISSGGLAGFDFFNFSSSMSDHGDALICFNQIDNSGATGVLRTLLRYDSNSATWTSASFTNSNHNLRVNSVSDKQGVLISFAEYGGQSKYYINEDALNLTKLSNFNEGIGIDGFTPSMAKVDVINNGKFLLTWIQDNKLMYMIN